MAVDKPPRVRRTAQNTQYTYELSRRIHDVKTHPVLSPQGATILIYGHENGVTLVWRGGRRFKPSKPHQAPASKQNGDGVDDDAVMVIDSDDDTPGAPSIKPFVDEPEFEETVEDNLNPATVQTLDLSLGSPIYHIAVLPISPCRAEDAALSGIDILKKNLVFVVSCANADLYLITLPLTPPSPESKARLELRQNLLAGKAGNGKWGESLTQLRGQSKHSDSLSMALIRPKTPTSERAKSSERVRSASSPTAPRVVVAAHCREASGTLRFWDVSLARGKGVEMVQPFQTEYLPSPLKTIEFSPSHTTQLLVVDSPHAVRVYDYSIPSVPEDVSEGPFPGQGSWLLSLYPPFARQSPSRKPIVAAAWIAHGRAVLVLLADGQWGIWDIAGASPALAGNGASSVFGRNASGVRGAAITIFSASGYLEGTSPLRNPASAQRSSGANDSVFMPMTPHTRRDASVAAGPEKLAAVRGGILVASLATRGAPSSDESAVIWMGGADHVVVIPRVARFWDAQVRKGAGGGVNLFSGAQPSRMIRLADLGVGLLGERCCGVGAMVRFSSGPAGSMDSAEGDKANEGLSIEIVIQGESRLIVIRESEDGPASFTNRLKVGRKRRLGERGSSAEPASAIVVHPRPEKPNSVAFNLTVTKRGSLRAPRLNGQPGTGMFDQLDEELLAAEAEISAPPTHSHSAGLAFADTLSRAADEMDEDVEIDNVQDEIDDEMATIFDIERRLEQMEEDRDSGRKHVFFEDMDI